MIHLLPPDDQNYICWFKVKMQSHAKRRETRGRTETAEDYKTINKKKKSICISPSSVVIWFLLLLISGRLHRGGALLPPAGYKQQRIWALQTEIMHMFILFRVVKQDVARGDTLCCQVWTNVRRAVHLLIGSSESNPHSLTKRSSFSYPLLTSAQNCPSKNRLDTSQVGHVWKRQSSFTRKRSDMPRSDVWIQNPHS